MSHARIAIKGQVRRCAMMGALMVMCMEKDAVISKVTAEMLPAIVAVQRV